MRSKRLCSRIDSPELRRENAYNTLKLDKRGGRSSFENGKNQFDRP
jgi:hypothetical protein